MVESTSLIRTLFVASRPLSWINTAYPFAAVYLLTTGEVDLALVIGTIFFLVPYNLAMYGVNDVFDYESDLANPRKGGAEGAKLPPRLHRATLVSAAVLAAPFVVALVIVGGQRPMSWAVLAVSLFAALAYSVRGLRFKEIPVLDSITSSTHFVTPALYALALAGTTITPAIVLTMVAFSLGHGQSRLRGRAGRRARPRGGHRLDRHGLRRCGDGQDRGRTLGRGWHPHALHPMACEPRSDRRPALHHHRRAVPLNVDDARSAAANRASSPPGGGFSPSTTGWDSRHHVAADPLRHRRAVLMTPLLAHRCHRIHRRPSRAPSRSRPGTRCSVFRPLPLEAQGCAVARRRAHLQG